MSCAMECEEMPVSCGPRPNPLIMAARFAALALGILVALGGMIKERKFKHLAAWLGAWGVFLTYARYLICARCEGYGKMCYSHYMGKYTSMIFPRVEDKEPGTQGNMVEAICLGAISLMPALALRDDRKLMLRYLAFLQFVFTAQFFHACRRCAANSTQEWKKKCPGNRAWDKLRG